MQSEDLNLTTSLTHACHLSFSRNALVNGARQSSKYILRGEAKLLVLNKKGDKELVQILEALAKQKQVKIIKVEDEIFQTLTGLKRTRLDETEKHPKCAALCIKDFVDETREEVQFLMGEMEKSDIIEI